jgi:hypothetical protein
VVFASQHSGTARYYGGRYTLRFDLLDDHAAGVVIADVEQRGLHPYLVVDDAEIAAARRAFRLTPEGPPPWPYVARRDPSRGVSVFDLSRRQAHPSASRRARRRGIRSRPQ